MSNPIRSRLREIYKEIEEMRYTEDNLLDLYSLVKEAKELVKKDDTKSLCYNNFK